MSVKPRPHELEPGLSTPDSRDLEPPGLEFDRDEDQTLPLRVLSTREYMQRYGLWFQLSRNLPAASCRDAAKKRWRLGHEGIPLWDELKSFLGTYRTSQGERRLFLAHCRGDRVVDLDRVRLALHASSFPARLTPDEVTDLDLRYGLINPFPDRRLRMEGPLAQVFDIELMRPIGLPGTMMTNAGELTWAIEFKPDDLIEAIRASEAPESRDSVIVGDIADPDLSESTRPAYVESPRTIGILTGNAPESGMTLWAAINDATRRVLGSHNYGDISMPPVRIISAPAMGLSMELDERTGQAAEAVLSGIEDLCSQGARLICVACNTTQFFAKDIRETCRRFDAEFVSMPEVIADWLHWKRRKLRHLDRDTLCF